MSRRPASPSGSTDASTYSTSPPRPVTASPVATPGSSVRSWASGVNRGRPISSLSSASSTSIGAAVPEASRVATLRNALATTRSSCRTPASRVWWAAISRSAPSVMLDLVLAERRPLALPRHQEVPRDRDLVVLGVAVEGHQLHPVQQRAGDLLDHVGGGDEEHVGQVQVELEVVVAEGVVLRGVEHLEQRGRRVAAVVGADLVDLVEEHHRVHRPGLLDRADDPAGQRADVGPAVAPDLGLVADAAEGDADELPAEGAGDGLAERGLADPRRSDQQDHGAAAAAADDLEAALGAAGRGRRGARRSAP